MSKAGRSAFGDGLIRFGAACLCAASLIGCATSGDRPERAASAPEQAPASALARYAEGLAALEAGHVARATATFETLTREYPQYSGPLRQLAWLAVDAGADAQAFDYLLRALKVCEACASVLTDLGVLHRQRGEFDAAEQAYRDALAADRDYAPAHFNIAVLFELYRMRPRPAIDHYERYLALEEDDPDAGLIRAWVADLERQAAGLTSTAQIETRP
ncbi:MAG: tetratricopeptide repeat protein [Gammaproteobacteria bacterium]|nr:tetratricopeptide repeat protein [Gammaproteobacteria bacterium]